MFLRLLPGSGLVVITVGGGGTFRQGLVAVFKLRFFYLRLASNSSANAKDK